MDDNAQTRPATCTAFLRDLDTSAGEQQEEMENFKTIYSRFFLEKDDAVTLLGKLNQI